MNIETAKPTQKARSGSRISNETFITLFMMGVLAVIFFIACLAVPGFYNPKNIINIESFDRIYRTYFSTTATLPARTRMQAGRTPMDCELEVEAIGYIPGAAWGAPQRTQRAAKAGKKVAKKRNR